MRERTNWELAGTIYATKKAVEQAVRNELARVPLGIEFVSPLISDLIAKHHRYCSAHGLRPERFVKAPNRCRDVIDGYQFRGWFPGLKWKGVSWRNSIYPPTWRGEVSRMMRRMIADEVEQFRLTHYQCSVCGKTTPPLNAHHIAPTHAEMVASLWPLITPQDEQDWLNEDWTQDREFELAPGHPARDAYLKAHHGAALTVLCSTCHKTTHAGKDGGAAQ